MNITSFKNKNFHELFQEDETKRIIGYSYFEKVELVGRNNFYPNILLYTDNSLFSPYDEKIMSLNKDIFYDDNIYDLVNKDNYEITNIINESVFFFIYNFDNYYHFIYDSLPYLFSFLEIKNKFPNLKLLINYPNINKKNFYKFNTEILKKIINWDDIIIHKSNNIYSKIYISTSLTHGGFSNNAPRKEIFNIYEHLKKNINFDNIEKKYIDLKNIYISRRTWINKDDSNIGTDYTTRRKMVNEDEFVETLTNHGFTEIFAENLNIDEKIYLFSNANKIIGAIGGGMANLLFSPKKTKTYVIVSPFFLEINYRFKYSMDHTQINYFFDVKTYLEENKISLFCRVKIIDKNNKFFEKYGEIIDYDNKNNNYLINISNNDVAGFNNKNIFERDWLEDNKFELLDNGLNSPYLLEIDKFMDML